MVSCEKSKLDPPEFWRLRKMNAPVMALCRMQIPLPRYVCAEPRNANVNVQICEMNQVKYVLEPNYHPV